MADNGDKNKGGKEIIVLCTKTYKGKTYELSKDVYNWRIRCGKSLWYYSSFQSFITDLYNEAFKHGLDKIDVQEIKQINRKALTLIENTTKYADDEINRLENVIVERDETISSLNAKLKRAEKSTDSPLSDVKPKQESLSL